MRLQRCEWLEHYFSGKIAPFSCPFNLLFENGKVDPALNVRFSIVLIQQHHVERAFCQSQLWKEVIVFLKEHLRDVILNDGNWHRIARAD